MTRQPVPATPNPTFTRRACLSAHWRRSLLPRRLTCEIHHILPWEQGGPTDIDSMCLACPHCHRNIHDRGYVVIRTKTGYRIINPNNPPRGP